MKNTGYDQFIVEARCLVQERPEFIFYENEYGLPVLTGEIILYDQEGVKYDSYSIKVEYKNGYPNNFPAVYEIGGRIPRNIDWHIFEHDGSCCIKSAPEKSILCKDDISLIWFIDTQVVPYFHNQKFREINGYYLNERSHGYMGNNEFFKEVFATNNLKIILDGLVFVTKRQEPNRVAMCFCGSKKKFRHCHRSAFRILSRLSNEELDYYIKTIIKEILSK